MDLHAYELIQFMERKAMKPICRFTSDITMHHTKLLRNPDEEHRVWYAVITRQTKRLLSAKQLIRRHMKYE